MEDLELLADYRQRVIQDTRFVKLAGIPLPRDRSGRPLHIEVPLDRVYIRVQAVLEETGRAQREAECVRVEEEAHDESLSACDLTGNPEAVRALGEYLYRQNQEHKESERPTTIDPQDALSEHKRLAILGAPGAGKSTMLRYLARKAAEDANAPIPILVYLRDYATYCGIDGTDSLYDFALGEVAKMCNYDKTNLLRAIGSDDRILWLVDGLDEARGWREKVVGQIRRLPGDLVITSRPVGYQKAGLESLPHFEILPLETEDIEKFLNDWFGVFADQGDLGSEWVEERVSWLKDQLKDRPRIGAITNNPLLLTFLVILGGEDPLQDLPTGRGELYHSYVEKLLNSWEENRRPRSGAEGTPELSLGTLVGDRARGAALDGFYYIGWHLHFAYYGGKGEGQPTRSSLVDSLNECLKKRWNLANGDAKITSEDVVDFWQEAGILDVWRLEKREYIAFRHMTFEEYSAARSLAEAWDKNSKDVWKFLRPRLHHYAWREPILLLAGMLDQDDLNLLLRNLLGLNHNLLRFPGITWLLRPTCLPLGPSVYERFLHRDLFLAGNMLVELPQIDENIKNEVIRVLTWLVHKHSIRLLLTLILIYFLVLYTAGLFIAGQFFPVWIFWTTAIIWTTAWIGAFIIEKFLRIRGGLSLVLGIWNYVIDREIVIILLSEIGAEAVADLVLALKDGDCGVRRTAAKALGHIGDVKTVSDLALALKDSDYGVRREAAKALGHIRDPQAVPYLVLAIKDGDCSVRKAAAEALGHIGDPQAVYDLVLAMKGRDLALREAAAEALGQIGIPAFHDLVLALKDGDGDVRRSALIAIGYIGDFQDIPYLILALKDDDRDVRRASAIALGHIGDLQAIPYLIVALKDGDRNVRRAAAEALGQIGYTEVVSDLALALKDADRYVRRAAAKALGHIGDVQAVPDLLLALKDSKGQIRGAAARALGEIGDLQAVPDLILVLEDNNEYVRQAAAEALGEIGDIQAVPDLILALKDGHSVVRRAAAEALGEIGDVQAVPDLITALKDGHSGVRGTAAKALGEIGDVQAVPDLILYLKDSDWGVRRATAKALGQIGDVQAVPDLIIALKDGNWRIREDATESLNHIAAIQVVPDLIKALKYGERDVRLATIKFFGNIKDAQAVPDLILALNDDDWGIRRTAAEALGEIGDVQAVPHLILALKDSDWGVRRAAAKALGEIGDVRAVPDLVLTLRDGKGHVRGVAAEALGLLAGNIKKLDDVRSVSHALRWRLTDQIFNTMALAPTFHALNLAASRLAVLEAEALPSDDPLSRPEVMAHSRWPRNVKRASYLIISAIIALLLQIVYGILTGQITDMNEGIALLIQKPYLAALAVVLCVAGILFQEYRPSIKE